MAGNLIRTVLWWTCPAALCGLLLAAPAEGSRHAGSPCPARLTGASAVTPVGAVQGPAHTSPLHGRTVTTTGIVTAVDTDGFYLQDPAGDGDPLTSDGLFVFTGGDPEAAVGDRLCVRGRVGEFQPGGAATRNLTITQITRPRLLRLSRGNRLPAPVVLGAGGRVPPRRVIDNDGLAVFDPAEDGIDFYETLESMRVVVRDAVAVSPTTRFGEVFVRARGTSPSGLSERGVLVLRPDDFNPERIQIDDDLGLSPMETPAVAVGDSLGDVVGVMGYGFGNYEVRFTEPFTPAPGRLEPETAPASGGEFLTIASFNVQNLDPNDSDGDTDVAAGRFDAVASVIARNLRSPDIVALQEVQDNDGAARTGVTAADATLGLLVERIAALGPVRYRFIDNPFIGDGTNGGQRGGNVRVAFLYNPDRVELVPGSLATVTDPADQRTNSGNPFFNGALPLAARFRPRMPGGASVTVVNNHFRSKLGGSPPFGAVQPFTELQEEPHVNGGLDRRRRQARTVRDFVARRLAAPGSAHVVVAGDFNEFAFVSPLKTLEGGLLRNLTNDLPASERYTYIHEGNAQSLDHVLVSPSLSGSAEVDIVHVNAEFPATPARASDHDPVLVRLRLPRPD